MSPDAMGNLTLEEMMAQSPLTQAFMGAFNRSTLPVIQNQMQLTGHGRSPAVGVAAGDALAQALPQILFQGEGLSQNAAQMAANIANQEQMRQLETFRTGGQFLLGAADPMLQAAQLQQQQQQMALNAFGGGGELQRGITQQSQDALQAERLRQQGLSESLNMGVFGNVIPSTLGSQTSKTKSSK